ncbi:transposase [Streptomyces sp. NPDC008121]|uniref:IS110 family transposase n=1 Tax=Streptomyces sp. NPDC008121 TaxID=3364809 RepID=UPI0036ED10E2
MLVLFIGDDWAEDHHDVEVQDETGRRLGTARLPEGVEGIAKLHALIARHGGEDLEPGQVRVGIETDRGPWVQALIAAGYRVYAVNPRQAARFRERYGTSGAKSDKGDAHALADMVRVDGDQLRPVAGDSEHAQAIKVVARAHQTLIWERTRAFQRLRNTLREYFPGALNAYAGLELTSTDALELLVRAPTPQTAVKLTKPQIIAVLARHRRRNRDHRAAAIQAGLREPQLAIAAFVVGGLLHGLVQHRRHTREQRRVRNTERQYLTTNPAD